jgi:hypothetical protein
MTPAAEAKRLTTFVFYGALALIAWLALSRRGR